MRLSKVLKFVKESFCECQCLFFLVCFVFSFIMCMEIYFEIHFDFFFILFVSECLEMLMF